MVVQHNLRAMNSNRMLGLTQSTQAKSTEKLSSGYKINRAADDAAGLSISEKMRKQMRGLTQASANAQDGISAVQTAEGALTEVHDMLQRMNELAVKAANGTMSENDRNYVQNEIDQLVTEIDRVAETTKFNETYLLKGSGKASAQVKAEAKIGDATIDPTVNAAKGNIYAGAVNSTLGANTDETAKLTYLDGEGNKRTQEVSFKVGANDKATAENLAKAINDDSKLGRLFSATVDESGKLAIESKLDGNKTDSTKNAVTSVKFGSETKADGTTAAATLKTTMAGTQTAAIGESVSFNLANLANSNTVTIDGRTFTFDAANSDDDANKFKNVAELAKALGEDYEVTVSVERADTYQKYKWDETLDTPAQAKDGGEYVVVNTGEMKDATKDKVLTTLALSDFDTLPSAQTAAVTGDADETDPTKNTTITLGTAKYKLNIARKATTEIKDSMNLSLHVGADSSAENKISIDIQAMNAKGLGVDGLKVNGANSKNADNAIDTIAAAIQKVSTQRSALGAVQNRLEHTINNLDNVVENTTSAESAIRDTDMATEMVRYSNNNILAQAGQAMLAQANQSNQGVLSLLG